MRVIETTIDRVRIGFGPKQRMKNVHSERPAFLCPSCEKLVSYIPMDKIKNCVYCGQSLDWSEIVEAKVESDDEAQEAGR